MTRLDLRESHRHSWSHLHPLLLYALNKLLLPHLPRAWIIAFELLAVFLVFLPFDYNNFVNRWPPM